MQLSWRIRTPSQPMSSASNRPAAIIRRPLSGIFQARRKATASGGGGAAKCLLGVSAGDPVHFVGTDAGDVVALEEPVEPPAQELYGLVIDEALLDNEEAVTVERLALLAGPLLDQPASSSTILRCSSSSHGGSPAAAFSAASIIAKESERRKGPVVPLTLRSVVRSLFSESMCG